MLSLFKSKKTAPQKDIALFTLETVEAIIHLPLEKMLVETVENIKDFFETKYACIHFYPNIGLGDEIALSGLLSCPLFDLEPEIQSELLKVESRLDMLAMSSTQTINHKDIFQEIAGWDKFRDYFDFSDGVTVPLVYQGEVFGALNIYHTRSDTILNESTIEFLRTLGSCLYGAVKKEVLIGELIDRDDLIEAFAKTIEASDLYTGGHVDRVMSYSMRLGEAIELSGDELKILKKASVLHDIGKVGVPDHILNKPGPLTEEERKIIETHPVIAEVIFENVNDGPLKQSMDGVLYHHERIDGKGYPRGLKGEEIPLIARIIAIADTFDALTSDRPYRKGMDLQKALSILEEVKGSQLDAKLVETFVGQQLYQID